MNNTFCVKRFALYARKHYWENRLFYLLLIIISFLAIILFCTNFSLFSELIPNHNNEDSAYTQFHIRVPFKQAFLIVGIVFILAVASRVVSGTKGAAFKMRDMLLPISFQERFWFMVINLIIIAPIVFLIIFIPASSYVESLYLFGDTHYLFKGLPLISKEITAVEPMINVELFTFADFFDHNRRSGILSIVYYVNLFAFYLYCVAAMIWGSITFNRFKRFRLSITILSHIIIILVMMFSLRSIINIAHWELKDHDGLHLYFADNMYYIILIFAYYVPSIVYFFVSWKKLKTLEIYN